MKSPGDLAESVAADYLSQFEDQLTEEELAIDQAGPMEQSQKAALFKKIEFRWRPSDRKLLEAIRASVDATFTQMFSTAFDIIDEFYNKVRISEHKTDGDGRPVWRKENGRFVEDWSQLQGPDITQAIFNLQRVMFAIADQQAQLLNEAIQAKHAEDDQRNSAWLDIYDGTVGDRNAKASTMTVQDKYHAFFRYALYQRSQAFTKELNRFMTLLEKMKYWEIQDRKV